MTVCTRHACQAKVHNHLLESLLSEMIVMKNVRTTPQTIELRINFCLRVISDSTKAIDALEQLAHATTNKGSPASPLQARVMVAGDQSIH